MADEYKRFELVQAERHQEQAHYWTRFIAFSTLHAGLFVLATSTNLATRPIAILFLAIMGLVLAALWAEVQRLSLKYVDRWKPAYHRESEKLKFDFSSEHSTDPRFSSTDLALMVPYAVLVVWGGLIVTEVA